MPECAFFFYDVLNAAYHPVMAVFPESILHRDLVCSHEPDAFKFT